MPSKPSYEELQARVKDLETLLDKRTRELSREITGYTVIKADLEKRTFELNQRIIELKAVLQMTTLSDTPNISLRDFFKGVLKIVISSFQYPEIAFAELKVGEEVYQTEDFQVTPWKIGRGLMDQCHKMIGYLTVYYKEERPAKDHGPFTKEEKNLMVMISRYLVQIIQRKRTEEENRKFEAVIEQSPAWIAITNDVGVIEYVNAAFYEVMGYDPDDILGNFVEFAETSEENQKNYAEMQKVIMTGKIWRGNLKATRKDMMVIWVSLVIFPVIENSHIKNYVCIGNDITYQKILETQKQIQQERHQKLVENIPLAISIINRDNLCIYSNSIANRIFGDNNESLEGRTIQQIIGIENADQVVAEIGKVFKTHKRIETEQSLKVKGKFRFFRTLRLPLFDEHKEVSSVLIIAEDITELKRQEFLLKIQHKIDSLSNLTASLNASIRSAFRYLMQIDWVDGGGIYLFDEDEKHLRLAYSEGLFESFVQRVSLYRREDAPVQMILLKKPKYSKTSDFTGMNGEAMKNEGLVMAVSIPLVYQDKVIGSLNLGSRTTDELSTGDQLVIESIANRLANLIVLVQTREKLVRTNYELNVSLKEIREKQELLIQKSKLESLGELAAGLAHEINQPLSVISLAFENISYRLLESPVNQDYFTRKSETISQNIEKIRQLIDHIRIFSRDQSSVMFEKTDINLAINETLALMQPQMAKMHIKIDVDLCKGRCVTLGNLTKLEQVMLNLVSNARDAVEEKASMSRYAGYHGRIYIETAIENKKIIVKVEDNGIGIKPENMQKIFTPFFTTKPPGQGTGLGLAIVYGIITEMKGTIEIFSEFEKFTNILLTFPKI